MIMAGTKKIKYFLLFLFFFSFIQSSKSQEIGFSLLAYPSPAYNLVYEPGMNGFGASIFVKREKSKKLNLSMSAEYAMTSWGHQTFLGFGINRTWVNWQRFQFTSILHMLNGLALHKPQSIYVFGVDTRAHGNFHINQDLKLFLGVGIRYTLSPGYRQYGIIETSLDLPVEFGVKYVISRYGSW
jgi:hypothetical protein